MPMPSPARRWITSSVLRGPAPEQVLPLAPARAPRAAGFAAAGAAVASVTHFFTKLFFAAPASFFSAAWALHVVVAAAVASFSHFLTKLVLAAPASFFSVACASQAGSAANAAVLANNVSRATAVMAFMRFPL